MAIKSVWIEEDCIACGTCEGICPEVFQVTDRSRVNEGVNFNDYEEGIKEAAAGNYNFFSGKQPIQKNIFRTSFQNN